MAADGFGAVATYWPSGITLYIDPEGFEFSISVPDWLPAGWLSDFAEALHIARGLYRLELTHLLEDDVRGEPYDYEQIDGRYVWWLSLVHPVSDVREWYAEIAAANRKVAGVA